MCCRGYVRGRGLVCAPGGMHGTGACVAGGVHGSGGMHGTHAPYRGQNGQTRVKKHYLVAPQTSFAGGKTYENFDS